MKIIYSFLIAFILSVIAFFLAFSLIDNSFVYVKMIKKVTGSIPNKKSAAPVLSVILIARKKASTASISAIIKA